MRKLGVPVKFWEDGLDNLEMEYWRNTKKDEKEHEKRTVLTRAEATCRAYA